ncbi:MAG: hypothetical protein FWE28_02960 [Oscillospiraceae bacterium]|nr:hypothetical protein [Oscillospiraceae bacterium]
MDTHVILSAAPEDLARVSVHNLPVAHMAYQIGQGFHLFRANIPLGLRGGLMMLGDGGTDVDPTSGSPETLASEIMRECIQRGFHGVVLAFTHTSPALHTTAAMLSGRLRRQGGTLYLPEVYAADSDWARILIPTAISGGSLTARLQEVSGHYGAERICLDIERIRTDFCLPSSEGQGKKLAGREFYALMQEKQPEPYFSQDLCAYYFTYQDDHGSHFVLYDDVGSIRKKLFLANKLGIDHAMLFYPEVEDLLPF